MFKVTQLIDHKATIDFENFENGVDYNRFVIQFRIYGDYITKEMYIML